MSSRSRCVADTIAKPTVAATRLVGGRKPAWTRRSRLGDCGWNRIPCRTKTKLGQRAAQQGSNYKTKPIARISTGDFAEAGWGQSAQCAQDRRPEERCGKATVSAERCPAWAHRRAGHRRPSGPNGLQSFRAGCDSCGARFLLTKLKRADVDLCVRVLVAKNCGVSRCRLRKRRFYGR